MTWSLPILPCWGLQRQDRASRRDQDGDQAKGGGGGGDCGATASPGCGLAPWRAQAVVLSSKGE